MKPEQHRGLMHVGMWGVTVIVAGRDTMTSRRSEVGHESARGLCQQAQRQYR